MEIFAGRGLQQGGHDLPTVISSNGRRDLWTSLLLRRMREHRGSWVTHALRYVDGGSSQGIVSAIIETHWYMARKNPAPAAITNSVFLVSGMIDPPQRPRAGTLFRLDLGSFVAFCRVFPLGLPEPYLRATTLEVSFPSTMLRMWRATAAMILTSSSS